MPVRVCNYQSNTAVVSEVLPQNIKALKQISHVLNDSEQ
jgi:hypothetical protein